MDERRQRLASEALILALTASAAFGLGRLSLVVERRPPVTIDRYAAAPAAAVTQAAKAEESAPGGVVASKTGSKYHAPWCSGAQSISEANKVWFATPEEARAAGYEPAKNCKGLK